MKARAAGDKYKEIDEARKLLGLGESSTFKEIKQAYRKLSLKYHPDKCAAARKKECEDRFKKINRAYETIIAYCVNYRFSFREDDISGTSMDKDTREHIKRFYDGWWGDLDL